MLFSYLLTTPAPRRLYFDVCTRERSNARTTTIPELTRSLCSFTKAAVAYLTAFSELRDEPADAAEYDSCLAISDSDDDNDLLLCKQGTRLPSISIFEPDVHDAVS